MVKNSAPTLMSFIRKRVLSALFSCLSFRLAQQKPGVKAI
ncbi:hypothetical protein FORC065_2855 [Yersinia enterocolitica]|nr:hypothetical protein FORC065_2855 [Yersinia enterocolitica]